MSGAMGLHFDVGPVPTARSPQDRKIILAEKRMKWIMNRDGALVAGIVLCRRQPAGVRFAVISVNDYGRRLRATI